MYSLVVHVAVGARVDTTGYKSQTSVALKNEELRNALYYKCHRHPLQPALT